MADIHSIKPTNILKERKKHRWKLFASTHNLESNTFNDSGKYSVSSCSKSLSIETLA